MKYCSEVHGVNTVVDEAFNDASRLFREGRLLEAEKIYNEIMHDSPYYHLALNALGIIAYRSGRADNAVELLNKALRENPDFAEAYCSLGIIYEKQGNYDKAESAYRKALEVNPAFAEAYNDLGIVMKVQGRFEEAEASYRKAIALLPDYDKPYSNLGVLLMDQGLLTEAEAKYRKAIELNPEFADAHDHLSVLLMLQGRSDEALLSHRNALKFKPDSAAAHSNLLFSMNFSSTFTSNEIYEESLRWDIIHGATRAGRRQPYTNDRVPARRLRIGYVSSDFHQHSVSYFFEPLLASHHRDKVHAFCYADVARPDATTTRLRLLSHRWRDSMGLTDEALADQIRKDRIDILVDLAGHTRGNRLPVFAEKPAPIQITWLGYPNTTGLAAIDYRITDAVADPEGANDKFYTEKLLRLPGNFLCYAPPKDAPDVSLPPVLQNGFVTFGSFNNLAKMSPRVVKLWAKVLEQIPGARLLLKNVSLADVATRERCQKSFAEFGIDPSRIDMLGMTESVRDHLALYDRMDIALDTFPYNGTTTSCEALWMGVPVIALAGERHAGRVGVSILSCIGLDSLIAKTPEEYVKIAVRLAGDIDMLPSARSSLREQIKASRLCDAEEFVAKMEDAYRRMWRRWCAENSGSIGVDSPGNDSSAPEKLKVQSRPVKDENDVEKDFQEAARFFEEGLNAEAEAIYSKILARIPNNPRALHAMGVIAYHNGRTDNAIDLINKALQVKSDYGDAYNSLGNVYKEQNKTANAAYYYRKALEIEPGHEKARINMGGLLKEQGKFDESEMCYRAGLDIMPRSPQLMVSLAMLLKDQGMLDEAIDLCHKALAIKPDCAEAYHNLGILMYDQGICNDAAVAYRKALGIRPSSVTHSGLLGSLNYMPTISAEQIYQESRRWEEMYGAPRWEFHKPCSNDPDPERRLRIGYISPDFCQHSVSYFFKPLLEAHHSDQVHVFCYSNVKKPDSVTAYLKLLSHRWRNCFRLSDDIVAEQIRHDKIDILVDLAGHTAGNRLTVLAEKPAPVQVTWLGYPATTGLTSIDYRMTDSIADPESEPDSFSSEKPYRLPGGFLCYAPPEDAPACTSLPALDNGFVTFGSFNNMAKITTEVLEIWALLLKRVKGSRLILKNRSFFHTATRERVLGFFSSSGIDPSRIMIRPFCGSPREHLALYNRIDISVDTFPYNGVTTTCESLWMGVPVITLLGNVHAGRTGASILSRVGLKEFIARTPDEYLHIAVRQADDLGSLAQTREFLRDRMKESSLCDADTLASEMENAYRNMWRRWCSDLSGASRTASPSNNILIKELPKEETASHRDENGVRRGQSTCSPLMSDQSAQGEFFADASRLYQQGNLEGAKEIYGRILQVCPDHPRALHALGVIAHQQGDSEVAINLISRAIEAKPDYADAYNSLGNMLDGMERLEEAVASYRKAIKICPFQMHFHLNLGKVLKHLGRFKEAEECYRRELELMPDDAETYYSLANLLCEQGRLGEAELSLRKTLEFKPDFVGAHNDLGIIMKAQGKIEEAEASYRKAISLDQKYEKAHLNLGVIYEEQGRLSEAATCYLKALQLKPDFELVFNNLGNVYNCQGRYDEAIECFRQALAIRPDHAKVHSNLLFTMNYSPNFSIADIYAESLAWGRCHAVSHDRKVEPYQNRPDLNRRLRIGYISPDFREHSVSYFFEPLLATHHRDKVHAFCYADVARPDATTTRLRLLSHRWRDCVGLTDEALADQIRKDRIDILVDLAGHTCGNRLLVFAEKPAPIQITWLGYPNATGLAAIDYRITDAVADPEGVGDEFYTEKLLRLPGSFLCYAPPKDAPDVSPPPVVQNGFVTFGSFNNLAKMTSGVMELWARLLGQIPEARLFLKNKSLADQATRERCQGIFAGYGIDPSRIDMVSMTESVRDHLSLYGRMDIALDTFPYNGTTTTCESLWMGVPVVTLNGDRHAGRVGVCILSSIGHEEFIAKTPDEYIEIAVRLAGNLEYLAQVRSTLRDRMKRSQLCDAETFAVKMEEAYRELWRGWCEENQTEIKSKIKSDLSSQKEEAAIRLEINGRSLTLDEAFAVATRLLETGEGKEAMNVCRQIDRIRPNLPRTLHAFGNIAYRHFNHVEPAVAYIRQALELQPDYADALNSLGNIYKDIGKLSEAVDCYRRALSLNHDLIAGSNLGGLLLNQGRFEEAKEIYRSAFTLKPVNALTHSNLIFAMSYMPDYTISDIFEESRRWDAFHGQSLAQRRMLYVNDPDPERLLRVGYVSMDFGRHPVGYFLLPVLAAHDHSKIAVFCYSGRVVNDDLTLMLREFADEWRVTSAVSDESLAQMVRDDRIDILVDLSGHTGGNRLPAFAEKPAPLQVTWLGYWATTGLSAIDYVITDTITVPPEEECFFTEKVLRLPESRFCYAPPEYAPPVAALPALEKGYVTFGCFNNLSKVTSQVVSLWANLLHKIPDAKLILKSKSLNYPTTRENYLKMFADQQIGADRLEFRGNSPHTDMLAEYGDIDIALDPFPFSGGLTSCEAIWMGVPVVTLHGKLPVSRQTTSFLITLRLGNLVASTEEEYVNIASRLASDITGLGKLRLELRTQMAASSLCDGSRFTRNLEAAYREMWRTWCETHSNTSTIQEPEPAYTDELRGKVHIDGKLMEIESAFEIAERFFKDGHFGQAEEVCRAINAIYPNHPRTLNALGVISYRQGESGRALKLVQASLRTNPFNTDAYNNLGNIYREQGNLSAAEESFRRAVELQPDNVEWQNSLGNILKDQGFIENALECYSRAVALNQDFIVARSNFLFVMNYSPNYTIRDIYEQSCSWGKVHETPLYSRHKPHTNDRDPDRRLRIGYVSPDFGTHPVGFFIEPILGSHARKSIQTICYSCVVKPDLTTARLRLLSQKWRNCVGMSDGELVEQIRRDQIDILVDLAGHTGGNRLLVFAEKPAPVQVTWAGYVGTTGLSTMDYLISDWQETPEGSDRWYIEKVVRLPDCYVCYEPPAYAPSVAPLPALERGHVTFGCFNNLSKVTSAAISLWCRILRELPGARLLLVTKQLSDPGTRQRYLEMFLAEGVGGRVELTGERKHAELLASYGNVDIALDPFPYSGGLTTLESLWMGVPVITLGGDRFASRHTLSHLTAVGLPELIADGPDDYVARAVDLGRDLDRLAAMRHGLRLRMMASPLCDGPRFTRNLEAAYREMWRKWCAMQDIS